MSRCYTKSTATSVRESSLPIASHSIRQWQFIAPDRNIIIIVCSHTGSDLGKCFNFSLQAFAASFSSREFLTKLAMRIKCSCFIIYDINERVCPACKRPVGVYFAFKSTMSRPFVTFNIKERAEITILILAHHLIGYYLVWRIFTNRKPRYYPESDAHVICKALYCSFLLRQYKYPDLAVLNRGIVFSVDAAVRAPLHAAELSFHLFSSMHCHSMLSGESSSYFKNAIS